ncbi:hypothetical protein ANRL4_02720 [Anaerolineae bacterium]|nr:hypothetical protein ANRL4_02720 [Anaerolineae bacterium]
MSKRITATILILVLLGIAVFGVTHSANAQGGKLTLGEVIKGDYSGKPVPFTLDGVKGQFVVIQLLPDLEMPIFNTILKVNDPTGTMIANTSLVTIYTQMGSIVGLQFEQDGAYTVEVSTTDTNPGKFDLLAVEAPLLELDKTVESTVESASRSERIHYPKAFTLALPEALTLHYKVTAGDYRPALIVETIETGKTLYPYAYVGGRGLLEGTVSLAPREGFVFVVFGSTAFGDPGSGDALSATLQLTLSKASAQ